MSSKNPGQVTTYMDDQTLASVRRIAAADDRSVSWVISFAVKRYCVERETGGLVLQPEAWPDQRERVTLGMAARAERMAARMAAVPPAKARVVRKRAKAK